LHYFQNTAGSTGGSTHGGAGLAATTGTAGAALDLACLNPAVQTKVGGGGGGGGSTRNGGSGAVPMPRERMHQRGMSAVSPQDLLLNKGGCGDNKRKRASWDGRSR